jgi:ribosome-associated toxin RatA of RatAB toxin-antitoxin module
VDFAGILGKEICVGAMTIHFHDRTASAGLPLEGGNRWVSEDALALGEDWGNSETLGDALANGEDDGDDGDDGIEDRLESGIAVHTEKRTGRQRRIHALTDLPFTAEQLWQILTDYDNLASFIPNLTRSRRLSHPEGGIRIEQVGSQGFLNVKFCARVVLDAVEHFPNELRFSMVEGDFRQFEGQWTLEPMAGPTPRTRLGYDLLICPPRAMPAGLIERHIRNDLIRNLHAIGERATVLFGVS